MESYLINYMHSLYIYIYILAPMVLLLYYCVNCLSKYKNKIYLSIVINGVLKNMSVLSHFIS